jgi:hypothetical protein
MRLLILVQRMSEKSCCEENSERRIHVPEADFTASYYQWFMTESHNERIIGYEWHPEGEFNDVMTGGTLSFMKRENPGDTWQAPVEIGFMSWISARALAKGQGFAVEVAVT